jgi:hypothetical protein
MASNLEESVPVSSAALQTSTSTISARPSAQTSRSPISHRPSSSLASATLSSGATTSTVAASGRAEREGQDENEAGTSNFSTEFVDHSSTEGKGWFSISELMADTFPVKSRIVYLKAYKSFERFLKAKNQFISGAAPTEEQVLNYFHFLRHDLKWAPTTMWSTYARVNACVKRLFGFSLKKFVRVSEALKAFESGHKVKKASIFTPQQVLICYCSYFNFI